MSVKDKLSDYLTEITFHTAPWSPWQDKACTADLPWTRTWRHITCATEGLQRDKRHVQWPLIVYSAPPSPVSSSLLCHIPAHVHTSQGRKWFLLSGSVAVCVGVKLTYPQGTDLWPLCAVSYRAPSPSSLFSFHYFTPSQSNCSLTGNSVCSSQNNTGDSECDCAVESMTGEMRNTAFFSLENCIFPVFRTPLRIGERMCTGGGKARQLMAAIWRCFF